ncbi:hypothetical protein KUTeg_010152 [Tegillarca granosa]|uniref:RING-type domain-containing protein n=1 Tax=Tegillarca granosa TaxID=220873 RepID=A0ABQ9F636_TEGGR|nr:hypothetical protein KUTeg_010152 [Tegillarca granosa]
MAESVGSEDTYLNSCPICLETFKTPRTLPCLHTFCQTCLSSFITSCFKQNKRAFGFECPVCRAATAVPSDVNVEKWTVRFTSYRINGRKRTEINGQIM